MKIVSTTNQLNMDGLGAAFQASGIDFLFWNPANKPLLDMCHEVKPDIIFLTKSVIIQNQKAVEIACQKYPKMVWWNIELNAIKPRANLAQYGGGQKQDKYMCDIGMFTYNLPNNLSQFKLPDLNSNFRMWGSNALPLPNYVGELKQEERKHAIASCNKFFCLTTEEAYNATINRTEVIAPDGVTFPVMEDDYIKAINSTYFQEAAQILTFLNFKPEAELCLATHSKLSAKYLPKI